MRRTAGLFATPCHTSPKLLRHLHAFQPTTIHRIAESQVECVVEESLGQKISEAFETFDKTPLATASVAQVHAATLRGTGERVVVKVLKPGVSDTLTADLALFTSTAKILEAVAPETKRISLAAVAQQLRDSTLQVHACGVQGDQATRRLPTRRSPKCLSTFTRSPKCSAHRSSTCAKRRRV